ncbi:MAG: PRC-barrel domain-containing protein [Actinobacteria bacterium]|nr:PRC-barrel domain-containing protein [Actinomycetota bacterium]
MARDGELETEWTGHDLFDVDGSKIGTVEDVRFGDATGELKWLVVNTGHFGAKKAFVPAKEVRRSGDRLSVAHTNERIKGAPKVEDESVLTETEQAKLCQYYGLQYVSPPTEPQEGCVDMEDNRPAG